MTERFDVQLQDGLKEDTHNPDDITMIIKNKVFIARDNKIDNLDINDNSKIILSIKISDTNGTDSTVKSDIVLEHLPLYDKDKEGGKKRRTHKKRKTRRKKNRKSRRY